MHLVKGSDLQGGDKNSSQLEHKGDREKETGHCFMDSNGLTIEISYPIGPPSSLFSAPLFHSSFSALQLSLDFPVYMEEYVLW